MEITTSRLRLRSARPEALNAIHAVLSHREAMRWWSTPPHDDIEQSRAWLDAMIANTAAGALGYGLERSRRQTRQEG
ncbi:GNAT family N-acetyltransferase [Brevundimonas sp. SL161]|uniref:GNAT family N-acetyltransferase n=1 Tax=Brevundimonas sp. SL161 TaxID=2804613 RepID=UPI003CFA65A4